MSLYLVGLLSGLIIGGVVALYWRYEYDDLDRIHQDFLKDNGELVGKKRKLCEKLEDAKEANARWHETYQNCLSEKAESARIKQEQQDEIHKLRQIMAADGLALYAVRKAIDELDDASGHDYPVRYCHSESSFRPKPYVPMSDQIDVEAIRQSEAEGEPIPDDQRETD